MIKLNETQIKQIEALIAEMPGKFAIALLNVLNEAANSNSADANDDSVQPD
jgi:hypothetical protein